ncbi:DUF4136 domain-containing protein [Colwellia psychrerythraea]|uniref:DUF4136 domain-containing protein n=1 Tax=Colwellia psychrerythraea TaxID=28229 RepID=A0A099KWJ6_COLPS|nr:DUF4136 domain-containing protein [Colwellia psychrerythraea]KGJ94023.1 protein of unknown function DUF4136 [Colwellia psychrerythraea]
MNKIILIPLFLLVLSGCTTTYTANTDRDEEYDFQTIQSYFVTGDAKHKNPMISDIDRNRLNDAIDNEFNVQGLIATDEENADVLISYFVVTKDKMKIRSSGHSPSYGYSSRYGHAYGYSYGASNISTKNYTEGTFVIDIIDNKTKETVWRSTLVKPIKHYKTREQREQAVTELVNTMFADIQT